jgi:hypothetical protein
VPNCELFSDAHTGPSIFVTELPYPNYNFPGHRTTNRAGAYAIPIESSCSGRPVGPFKGHGPYGELDEVDRHLDLALVKC